MKIVVQKFGGTSIRTIEGFKKAKTHIEMELKLNHKVVCVVSAMGRYGDPYATDTLKNLIKNNVSKKEQDRLLSLGEIITSVVFTDYLLEEGIRATSLSVKETGIITNNNFTNADIIRIDKRVILQKLLQHDVVVVPGFQGLTVDFEVATLGRGGSDTTAIALGIALNADRVDIVSDVLGVFTVDPRIVPEAVKIPKLNYDVLVDMTQNGSRVLHVKGAVMAKNHRLKLRFVGIDNYNSFTEVEDSEVIVTNLSYKNDFIRYEILGDESLLNIKGQDEIYRDNDYYYVHQDQEVKLVKLLNEAKLAYKRFSGFSKIALIKYDSTKEITHFFVETNHVKEKLRELHQLHVLKG